MKHFKLTIEYDGTGFHGWQRQKGDRTVQAEIEAALAVMVRRQVVLHGSGRTDAGVHAFGQTASFCCETGLSPDVFLKGLNSLLAHDVVIVRCEQAPPGFHARYDARSKTYQYRILNRETPTAVGRRYHWHIRRPLDLKAMQAAAATIVGTHDFKSFEAAGSPRSHTVRTVTAAAWTREGPDLLVFSITADGFLRFMVRNLVGTFVDVGLGKIDPAGFKEVLIARDRRRAGVTAPPQGLFLMQVTY
jgi:tRNA pseudouridine38-40 synthase